LPAIYMKERKLGRGAISSMCKEFFMCPRGREEQGLLHKKKRSREGS